MAADEVAQRAQRRLEWQDTAAEAAASWKAMFRKHKRHRNEREAPPYGLDTLTVSQTKPQFPFAGLLCHTAYGRFMPTAALLAEFSGLLCSSYMCQESPHDACRDREAAGPHRQCMTSLKVNIAG